MSDQIELRQVRNNKSPEITVQRSNTDRSSTEHGRTRDPEQDVFAFAAETRATEQMQVSQLRRIQETNL